MWGFNRKEGDYFNFQLTVNVIVITNYHCRVKTTFLHFPCFEGGHAVHLTKTILCCANVFVIFVMIWREHCYGNTEIVKMN